MALIAETTFACPKDHALMRERLKYKFCPKGGEQLQDGNSNCDESAHTSMEQELGFKFCTECGLSLKKKP